MCRAGLVYPLLVVWESAVYAGIQASPGQSIHCNSGLGRLGLPRQLDEHYQLRLLSPQCPLKTQTSIQKRNTNSAANMSKKTQNRGKIMGCKSPSSIQPMFRTAAAKNCCKREVLPLVLAWLELLAWVEQPVARVVYGTVRTGLASGPTGLW